MKNILWLAACCISLSALIIVSSIHAQTVPDWENPAVFGRNQVEHHAELIPYQTAEQALHRNRDESPYFSSLNGQWRFGWFQNPNAAPTEFSDEGFDDSRWDEIKVPSNWQMEGYGHPMFRNVAQTFHSDPPRVPDDYNPTGLYRRSFDFPRNWTGRRILLHFEGVKSAFYVWVNGQGVGYNEGGMTAAEYDITDFVRPGANSVAVKVLRYSDGSYLEAQDMWRLSGIYRDVYLYSVPKTSIRDVFVQTRFDDHYVNAQLEAEIVLVRGESSASPSELKVSARLLDGDSEEVWTEPLLIEDITFEQSRGRALLEAPVESPAQWSAEKPHLYTLVLQLEDAEGDSLQTIAARFGFRQVEIRNRQIMVNGQAIKFNGVNRHEHHPRTGRMMTRETMEQDLRLMKRFNINLVRTSHYPPDPEFLELADEYGIYVVDEVNDEAHANQYLSGNPAWRESYLDRARGMIRRDRNHPSVIFWSAGNESGTGQNLAELIKLGHQLDPSRPGWMYGATSTTRDQPFEEIIGPRYPPPDRLEGYARVPPSLDSRPSFMDEYISASGNSLGQFEEYWSLIYRYPRLTGGAIWDWISPGITDRVRSTLDQSGNENKGYLMGRITPVEGRLGRAISLSGRDEWVEFYRSPSLDLSTAQLSLSLWIYPREWNGTGPIITKGNQQFGLSQISESELSFYVQGKERVEIVGETPPDWQNNWHHLAAVSDGQQLLLYLDGEVLAEKFYQGKVSWSHFPIAVGKNVQTHGQNHEGPLLDASVDEVRIYERALKAEEISREAHEAGSLSGESLLAHLTFEEIEEGDEFYSLGIGARTYGLVWPDRQVQPELWQVKKTPQPIKIEALDLLNGRIRVTNRFNFTDLSELIGRWELREDSEILATGDLTTNLSPGERKIIEIDYPQPDVDPAREYWLFVSFSLREGTGWAEVGYEVAWEQLKVPFEVFPPEKAAVATMAAVELEETPTKATVRGADFEYAFEKSSGRLISLLSQGEELLSEGIRPNFWRAPTSNEMDEWRNPPIANWWFDLGLDRLVDKCTRFEATQINAQTVQILAVFSSSAEGVKSGLDSKIEYLIFGSGDILIDHRVIPWGEFPKWQEGVPMWLPKIGLQLKVDRSFSNISWYGRGPFENYPDRLTGAQVNRFDISVEDDFVPYLFPQDYGNRSEVRWMSISNGEGKGLVIVGSPWLDFSAHHYDVDNLTRAQYLFQLEKSDKITLNLDGEVTGVGGTPVPTLPKYRVAVKPHRYSMLIRPFNDLEADPEEIAHRPRP